MGFSFDGIHSDSLNIVRVSEGDGYSETLFPEIEDKTLTIPGRDGQLYFGSNFTTYTIPISIAFDSMLEKDFRKMRKLFSTKKVCPLIFDERPFKVYMAKINGPIELTYTCFDEPYKTVAPETEVHYGVRMVDDGSGNRVRERVYPYVIDNTRKQRVYKGEGTIEFVCMSPFAKSQFKILDLYGDFDFEEDGVVFRRQSEEDVPYQNPITRYENIAEWQSASGILPYNIYTENNIDTVVEGADEPYIPVYNAGDLDAPFYLYLPYFNDGTYEYGNLAPSTGDYIIIGMDNNVLVIKPFNSRLNYASENGIVINTHNHLIEGVLYDSVSGSWITTGQVYNNEIEGGDFGSIEPTDYDLESVVKQQIGLNCSTAMGAKIVYDYLYY